MFSAFKEAGSRNRKHTCCFCNPYYYPYVPFLLWTYFDGWGESTIKLLPKAYQYNCCHIQLVSISFVSLRNARVHLQSNTFAWSKLVENLCDMVFKKFQIVVLKEGCSQYVIQPFNVLITLQIYENCVMSAVSDSKT